MTENIAQADKLMTLMKRKGTNVDVPIDDMFLELFGREAPDDNRVAQKRIGAVVSRFNARAEEVENVEMAGYWRVVPGDLKRTYRLTVVR